MARSRLSIAKNDIIDAINALNKNVLTRSDIEALLANNRLGWRLALSTNVQEFVKFLTNSTELQQVVLDFPNRKEVRYTWAEASIFQILLTLRGRPYFSHYTAMSFNELTEQLPKTIYVTTELRQQGSKGVLDQKRIDLAFRGGGRRSNNSTTFDQLTILHLAAKNSNRLGIVESKSPEGERIEHTGIERTLIDIVVRPFYGGGIKEVAEAYRKAKTMEKVSVNALMAMLKKLDYAYPYHQSIGFLIERTGVYSGAMIDLIRKLPREYDFYLTYGMKEVEYSREWRLYYPKGL